MTADTQLSFVAEMAVVRIDKMAAGVVRLPPSGAGMKDRRRQEHGGKH